MKSFVPILFAGVCAASSMATANDNPNILIFLLDDVGYGQLGSFGGPIRTPNIDRVAKMGLRYANHHTTALCSPSRAALLTGRNHHSVGFGVIAEIATEEPGYTGRFPEDKFPLIEAFRQKGYRTAAFGKWHNTPMNEVGATTSHTQRPRDLGFERFYGFNGGDMSQYEPLVYDNEKLTQPNVGNPNYHFTTDMTDKAISWIEEWKVKGENKPFFAFYATGAAHAPHHAPPGYDNRYTGEFNKGWDVVREETFARQKAMGLFPGIPELTPRTEEIPAWTELSDNEKRLFARMQELFAGFVEHTDAEFGRLLNKLEQMGELENTIVIITSDNGASGEGGIEGSFNETLFFNAIPESLEENLARIGTLGTKESFNHYPAGWALAGNTPFQFFKQTSHEGGVADPFIIAWKGKIKDEGAIRQQYIHINDVLPTLMEITKTSLPETINNVPQKPLEGVSFAETIFDATSRSKKSVQYYEMLGNRGIWMDGWKAVTFHGRLPWDSSSEGRPFDDDIWQLYDLNNDRTESNDLSSRFPEKLAEMKTQWTIEAERYTVLPLNDSTSSRLLATRSRLIGGRTEFNYTKADQGIFLGISPPVVGNSHMIVARISPDQGSKDGVIVAGGGRFGGYALFVKENKLCYTYNYVGIESYELCGDDTLPPGEIEVGLQFNLRGGSAADAELLVEGQKIGSLRIEKLVPVTFGIADTFDVGADLSTPVSALYEAPYGYSGSIDLSVKIIE